MHIAIVASAGAPIHARTLEERPLGGMETGVIYLAQELHRLGLRVTVATRHPNPPLSVPLYIPLRALADLGEIDILVAVRDWTVLLSKIRAKRRFFWTGDSYDQPTTLGIGDPRVAQRIDQFLAVSKWHADTICALSGFPREKAWVLGNGIRLAFFSGNEPRQRRRLIYSSTPYRGLVHLPNIISSLRQNHPEVELHIFSGLDVYQGAGDNTAVEKTYKPLFEKLSQTPGCVVRGNIKQAELAKEFMRSSILAYPNTFEETSCITAMEAQAAGCAIVTSKIGALPETVKEAGLLIEGKPGSAKYLEMFTAALDQLLSDDQRWKSLSDAALLQAKDYDWSTVAKRFIEQFRTA